MQIALAVVFCLDVKNQIVGTELRSERQLPSRVVDKNVIYVGRKINWWNATVRPFRAWKGT